MTADVIAVIEEAIAGLERIHARQRAVVACLTRLAADAAPAEEVLAAIEWRLAGLRARRRALAHGRAA